MSRFSLLRGALAVLFAVAIGVGANFVTMLPAEAQTVRQVRFEPGASGTTLRGTISGREYVDYVLGVRAGQHMYVELNTDNGSNYFNITAPGAEAALFIGSISGTSYDFIVPSSGDYTVRVYLTRNAGREGQRARFSLAVSVKGGGGSYTSPNFADHYDGGPDYWRVDGLGRGDTLNMREGPSTSNRRIATLSNGEVLYNLGCKAVGTAKWCRVRTVESPIVTGWVNSRYLKVSSGKPDPTVSAPSYGSTQTVKCRADSRQCIRDAQSACAGSYLVLDSRSYAGGLLADALPGPVTWYSLTFQCGPSDGREPRFRFTGPSLTASPQQPSFDLDPAFSVPQSVDREQLVKLCRGEGAGLYGTRPGNLDMRGAEQTPYGFEVFGSYDDQQFYCEFTKDGAFLQISQT